MDDEHRSFFTHYADRYMAGDAEAVADLCAVPFIAVRSGSPIDLADRTALVTHLGELMKAYRAAGAAVAEITAIDVFGQGDSAGLATVRWNVRSASGETIKDFRTSYQLVGTDPWRIVSYANHDTVRPRTDRSA